MKPSIKYTGSVLITIPLLFLSLSCAAGHVRFTLEVPAGFWFGLWHGMISVISLIIHIFNESVSVYEINNTGGWYDFGFLLGVICIWGGGSHVTKKQRCKRERDREWDEVCDRVEKKVVRKLKEWSEDESSTGSDTEWDEIEDKVERKVKRKIREWAERD